MGSIMSRPTKIAHVTTIDLTLRFLLLGQLRRLVAEGYDVAAISAPGPWSQALEAEGVRFIPWPSATRTLTPRSDARAFAELYRIFRNERFDLVHTHNPKPGVMGRLAGRLAGIPAVVNTVHGLYATPEDRARRRIPVLALERAAAWFSDLELYQSEEDLEWARRVRIVGASKSLLLSNGTDIEWFDPRTVPAERIAAVRRDLGVPPGALVVGMVGRMVAEKGYREFFESARAVRSAIPEARFLAVGSPDTEKADAIGREEMDRAREFVTFTGWREDVRDLIAVMDVFVLPSWREGVPRSAIEAAAMGRAMVLTDVRGCREVARDDEEALFVPPRNSDRLAAAIMRLLGDAALRERLGRAARRRAERRFDERRVEEIIVRSYRALLAGRGLPTDGEKVSAIAGVGEVARHGSG
jgi:glycosyltransferase involved in cell wall biosynthesis